MEPYEALSREIARLRRLVLAVAAVVVVEVLVVFLLLVDLSRYMGRWTDWGDVDFSLFPTPTP